MAEIKIGMTIEEASEYTGIGRNTMRKLVEWEKIPVLRIGRKAIIRRDVLERFMAANEGKTCGTARSKNCPDMIRGSHNGCPIGNQTES